MLSELLHERAALYVAGAMTAPERDTFELLLDFHEDLRAHVASLQKVGAAMTLSRVLHPTPPPSSLRHRVLASLATRPRQIEPEPMVVTDPFGCIEWINNSFTQLCGHTLAELKGRKPAEVLQGPETDQKSVQRIREAVHARRPCREQLLNYHKDGTQYRVEIAITPVLDDSGQPLWFVAKERKLALA